MIPVSLQIFGYDLRGSRAPECERTGADPMPDHPTTVATITIGQSPRDDVVPAMRRILPVGARIIEYGALDGLTRDEIDEFAVRPGEVGIVTRLRDDSSVLLSHELILPKMQEKADHAVQQAGAHLLVILCGADWSALRSPRLIVNPGRLFPGIVTALAAGRRLGIIKPDAGQVARERERYAAQGIDAIVTSASPYAGPDRLRLAREVACELRDARCELVWMTCVGMDEAMRGVVSDVTAVPVILAQALLARVVSELLPATVGADALVAG
jgi:protein AroM